MFFSTSHAAEKSFGVPKKILALKEVQTLFANQGLYNGFLAAGLFWGLFFAPSSFSTAIIIFFLSCVIIAAIFGAVTANKSILIKQGVPAILALLFVLFV